MSEEKGPKDEFVETEDCKHSYVDSGGVLGTLYGFELRLGKRKPIDEKSVQHSITNVIHMSPQHLKDLACVMLDNVKLYEEKFGEINSQFVLEEVKIRKKDEVAGPTMLPSKGIPGVN
jgi:hypothetical protein